MKNSKIISLSAVFLVSATIPLTSQAFSVDVRGGYRSGSHAYETRLKVSHGWQNGFWASLETDSMNPVHANGETGRIFKLAYNEMETNYSIKLNDQWTLRPGMLTHWDSKGTRLGPYLKLSWDVTKNLNLGVRYRYDFTTYNTPDLAGLQARPNQHRWDGYVTYKMSDKLTAAWQTTVYTYQHNYRYLNGKRWATENAFVLLYKLSDTITPYIEYDYLDKQAAYNGKTGITENSYRVGVTFNF